MLELLYAIVSTIIFLLKHSVLQKRFGKVDISAVKSGLKGMQMITKSSNLLFYFLHFLELKFMPPSLLIFITNQILWKTRLYINSTNQWQLINIQKGQYVALRITEKNNLLKYSFSFNHSLNSEGSLRLCMSPSCRSFYSHGHPCFISLCC